MRGRKVRCRLRGARMDLRHGGLAQAGEIVGQVAVVHQFGQHPHVAGGLGAQVAQVGQEPEMIVSDSRLQAVSVHFLHALDRAGLEFCQQRLDCLIGRLAMPRRQPADREPPVPVSRAGCRVGRRRRTFHPHVAIQQQPLAREFCARSRPSMPITGATFPFAPYKSISALIAPPSSRSFNAGATFASCEASAVQADTCAFGTSNCANRFDEPPVPPSARSPARRPPGCARPPRKGPPPPSRRLHAQRQADGLDKPAATCEAGLVHPHL